MGFGEANRTGLSKYATFSGRARRSEYWFWVLFGTLIGLGAFLIDRAGAAGWGEAIGDLIGLILLLPTLAVSVRRLHDIDRTGWWLLINFIPLLGIIVLLVWYCTRGTIGLNRYGPDPLDETFSLC